jgi:outer membrane protein assembly factor BamB
MKPLRLWPGVLAVTLQWLIMFGLPAVAPQYGGMAVAAGVVGALVVAIWWLFFSRAPWLERLGAIVLMVAAVAGTLRVVHESISNGMMGFMPFVYAAPLLSLSLVGWAAASRGLSSGRRRAALVAAVLMACGVLTLVRTDGISGDAVADFEWRWSPTAEEKLLADLKVGTTTQGNVGTTTPANVGSTIQGTVVPNSPDDRVASAPIDTPAAPAPPTTPPRATAETGEHGVTPAEWPGFRGPMRDSVIRAVRIDTDWSRTPPVQLWRMPIGPAWSSFAVAGDRVFTQEQRGEHEIVAAYSLKTGEAVWMHRDAARFWESNAGAGPRATPTLSDGRVYTLGGTGILNVLDARNGSVIWSRNAASDTGTKVPDWGIASSPLVIADTVIVATAGSLAAYELSTGKPRWFGPKDGWGYASPHLATIDGVAQIVLLNGPGVISVSPADGAVLWKHEWPGDSILQPAMLAGNDLLIGSGSGLAANTGMLRINVGHDGNRWSVKERWTSTGLKPYFSDFIVHEGHAFGFDGSILASIDVETGARKWKGGRYGHGQLVLLADQDLLLVLSEDGDLALVSATPDKFTEVAKFQALNAKTWNHPVLVGDVLLIRNGEEMAAFRLAGATR